MEQFHSESLPSYMRDKLSSALNCQLSAAKGEGVIST